MLISLGLSGDMDDVELVQDVELAFGIRLPADQLARCETVGNLLEIVVGQLPDELGNAGRCASTMCFYRVRRAVLGISPHLELRPSTPIAALRSISIKLLYRALQDAEGLRPPAAYLSGWGGLCLFLALAVPTGWAFWSVPGWVAVLVMMMSFCLFRLSPVRLPPNLRTIRDLVELVTARNIGTLAVQGARLRVADAWTALQVVCASQAAANKGEIDRTTLIFAVW